MKKNWWLLLIPALLLVASKKKINTTFSVDFSALTDTDGQYQLMFSDSSSTLAFDSADGLLQSGSLPSGVYTISLHKILDANCPAFVRVNATGGIVSDLGPQSTIAALQGSYVLVTQCR